MGEVRCKLCLVFVPALLIHSSLVVSGALFTTSCWCCTAIDGCSAQGQWGFADRGPSTAGLPIIAERTRNHERMSVCLPARPGVHQGQYRFSQHATSVPKAYVLAQTGQGHLCLYDRLSAETARCISFRDFLDVLRSNNDETAIRIAPTKIHIVEVAS